MDAINAPILLLVEGKDEKDICELLLRKISPDFGKKIDIQHAVGGPDLLASAKTIDVLSGFTQLKTLAILVDAEERPLKTTEVWDQFKCEFVSNYPSINCNFLILPSSQQAGALETVFLQSLDKESNAIARCAVDFVTCVGDRGAQTTQAQKDKLTLTSYINANVKKPYSRIGYALQFDDTKQLFDFDHPSFKPLTDFLKALL